MGIRLLLDFLKSDSTTLYPTLVSLENSWILQMPGEHRLRSNPRPTQFFFWNNGLARAASCGDPLRHNWVVPSRIFGFGCTWLARSFGTYPWRPSLGKGKSCRSRKSQQKICGPVTLLGNRILEYKMVGFGQLYFIVSILVSALNCYKIWLKVNKASL